MSEAASIAALLGRIDRFCKDNSLSVSEFGRASVNDRSIVKNLREGRSPTLRTIGKIECFMAEYPGQQAAA